MLFYWILEGHPAC